MKNRSLLTLALASLLASGTACTKQTDLESRLSKTPVVETIDSRQFRFEGNKVTEQNCSKTKSEVTYGVISDAHGFANKAEAFAQKFREMGVSGIIVPGDLSCNNEMRDCEVSKSDESQIEEVLEAVAKTGLPVYVVPGNHEPKSAYAKALKNMAAHYPNIVDMTRTRVADLCGADLVSLPGYQDQRFVAKNGFWATPRDVNELRQLTKGLNNTIILVTHGPEKTGANPGPGTLSNGRDVGDYLTTQMAQNAGIKVVVSGHIHEAGGLAATPDGKSVKPGEWTSEPFDANFGTLEPWTYLDGKRRDGMAGTLSVRGNEAEYRVFESR